MQFFTWELGLKVSEKGHWLGSDPELSTGVHGRVFHVTLPS